MYISRNAQTDGFGLLRNWGVRGWHPDAGYSPIHAGLDFAIRPDRYIYMPRTGTYESVELGGAIGTAIKIKPDDNDNILFFIFHAQLPEHGRLEAGLILTESQPEVKQDRYGVGQPHTHFEVHCTPAFFDGLAVEKNNVGDLIERKCNQHGFDEKLVLHEIRKQCQGWEITEVGEQYIKRAKSSFRSWRKMAGSNVGLDDYYVIDPTLLNGTVFDE